MHFKHKFFNRILSLKNQFKQFSYHTLGLMNNYLLTQLFKFQSKFNLISIDVYINDEQNQQSEILKMQSLINEIQLKSPSYKKVNLTNIITSKSIYSNGQFCEVKLARIEQSDISNPILSDDIKEKKYALKIVFKERMRLRCQNYEREYNYIYNQIFALHIIDHPNIIKICWHFEDQNNIYILTQHGGLNLFKYSRKQNLNQSQIKEIFKQLCQGLEAIHSQRIMHRDLCLENIVIHPETNIIKIIDFGIAIQFTGGRTTALGMLTIMAPEVDKQKKYNNKADIWSLGIVLYELFHNRNPFVDETEQFTAVQLAEKRDKLQYEIDQTKMSPQAKILIKKMLSLNPQHRPSVQQILSDKWITGHEETINDKQKHQNYLADDDKKTKQLTVNMKERKSLFAFSESECGKSNYIIEQPFKQFQKEPEKDDDFFFDKIINKMTLDNSVAELQERLRRLLKVRAQQMLKKKELTLKYLAANKRNMQRQIQVLRKQE